jgi:hypothetical protein
MATVYHAAPPGGEQDDGRGIRGRIPGGDESEVRALEETKITWDPEADRRIKRSPFLMRRFIRKRIEERVASRGRTHVTEADVDESASMYRQYRFK